MKRLAVWAGVLAVLCLAPLAVRAQAPRTDAEAVTDDAGDDWLAQGGPDRMGPGMGGGGMPGGMHGGMRGRMRGGFAALDLTPAQKTKLADLRDAQQRKAIPIEADLKLARLDMAKLLRADRPDTHALDAQIDRTANLRASLMKVRVNGLVEMRSILTDAQRTKLRDMRMGGHGGKEEGKPKSKYGSGPH
jgi:Spy/CpxP family protein refolding chaperone